MRFFREGRLFYSPLAHVTFDATPTAEAKPEPATVPLVRVQGLERWERWWKGKFQSKGNDTYCFREGEIQMNGTRVTVPTDRDEIHCPESYTGPCPEGLKWKSPWMALPVEVTETESWGWTSDWGPSTAFRYACIRAGRSGTDRGHREPALGRLYTCLDERFSGGPAEGDRIVKLKEAE